MVDVGMVVLEQSPVMSVRVAAVPISFPAFDEVFSPAVFAGGGGGVVADAAPLAVVGTVTIGVSVLVDAGSELPAGSAGAAAVRAAPLAEAGEDTLDVVGLDVGELLFRTDSDDGLPMMVAESGAMSKFVRPDDDPVVALKCWWMSSGMTDSLPGCRLVSYWITLWESCSWITHTSDILLDKSDTIVYCIRSDLYLPIGPQNMW